MMIVGIDTGLANCGFAVLDFADPASPRLVRVGCIQTTKETKKRNVLASSDNIRRGRELYRALSPVISGAGILCVESISWPRNASAVGKMGLAWGVVAALAEEHGLAVAAASPQEIKKHMTNRKTASKAEIKTAVASIFPSIDAELRRAGVPPSRHEHPVDAVAAVLTCRESDVVRASLAHLRS